MENFKEVVEKWMIRHDHSKRWLSTKLGVQKNTLANWFSKNGKIPKMHHSAIKELIKNNNIHKNQIVCEFDNEELKRLATAAYRKGLSINELIEIAAVEHSREREVKESKISP